MTRKSVDNTRSLTLATEKANHLHYLLEFRVEQCAQFKQHQCQQHRPYTCFNWHFANQRRRRPVCKEDGTFNYSADVYCDKYDENTGICPDGDSCKFLHRVAGDVERRYHPRYYKTALCVHPTDPRGLCSKNGAHCAFAHSDKDLRQPLHDAMEPYDGSLLDAENRDKTSFVVEDPLWHDQVHVLSCYKTEQCRKPARLCRQGYACPFYHNAKDRRRPPALYKYRSTPCPAAKSADEWLEPDQCENGSECSYCHTRTEQQFHPEIYKSTKCNDMLEHGYCPRAVFCAFAHHDSELHVQRIPYYKTSETTTSTTAMVSSNASDNAPSPVSRAGEIYKCTCRTFHSFQNCCIVIIVSFLDSSCTNIPTNFSSGATPTYSAVLKHRQTQNKTLPEESSNQSTYFKAPGYERTQMSPQRANDSNIGRMRTSSLTMGQLDLAFSVGGESLVSSLPSYSAFNSTMPRSGMDNSLRGLSTAMDGMSLDDVSNSALSPITEVKENKLVNDVFSTGLHSASSPLQVPGPSSPFGPSSLTSIGDSLFVQHKVSNDSAVSVGDFVGSPNALSLFQAVVMGQRKMMQYLLFTIAALSNFREELQKQLCKKSEELIAHHQKLAVWEGSLKQARQACEVWKRNAEYYRHVAEIAESEKSKAIHEKEQALMQLELLKRELQLNKGGDSQIPFEIPSFTSFNSFTSYSPLEGVDQTVDGPVCARCGREKRSDVRNPSCPLCCS
uniref:RING finger protein unkempt n=1 Tax=Syphacia muris TaxID=451379 RepID=A0A158R621_9BILA